MTGKKYKGEEREHFMTIMVSMMGGKGYFYKAAANVCMLITG